MGPDDHFQDIKRVLSAIGGKANRVTVIMPLLYASRQHKRKGRESLDCAMALKELENLGVHAILTFDVHDPTIHNAIPNTTFENIFPTYSMLKTFIANECGNSLKDNMTVISPDTGAMDRAIYYANTLGVDVGMFYKRRDHSVIINGKNPIVQHEYIGGPLEGKRILIIDDMIASGESVVDIIGELSKRNVGEIFRGLHLCLLYRGRGEIRQASTRKGGSQGCTRPICRMFPRISRNAPGSARSIFPNTSQRSSTRSAATNRSLRCLMRPSA